MKKVKSVVLVILCFAVILSTMLSTTLSVGAAYPSLEGFGTYEDGIIPPIPSYTTYHNPVPDDVFPNPDFEQGLMYWTNCNGKKPADVVKLVTEGDNTFIQINATEQYDGIESVRFREDRIKPGDHLVTVYDWRGNAGHDIQVYLRQFDLVQKSRLTAHFKTIKEAKAEGEWNTSLCLSQYPVSRMPNDAEIFYGLGAQAFQAPNCTTQIDNIRIAKYDPKTGEVVDLDGNKICNIGAKKQPNDNKNSANSSATSKDETKEQDTKKTEDSKKMSTETLIIVIAIAAAAVVVIAVVVIIIVLLKKGAKK